MGSSSQAFELPKISGGTGFTPFYQLLHKQLLCNTSKSKLTRFTLIHSSRTPSELPPPSLLHPLLQLAKSQPERLRLTLFVDSLHGGDSDLRSLYKYQIGRVDKCVIERSLGLYADNSWWKQLLRLGSSSSEPSFHERNVLVLVCGPEP